MFLIHLKTKKARLDSISGSFGDVMSILVPEEGVPYEKLGHVRQLAWGVNQEFWSHVGCS